MLLSPLCTHILKLISLLRLKKKTYPCWFVTIQKRNEQQFDKIAMRRSFIKLSPKMLSFIHFFTHLSHMFYSARCLYYKTFYSCNYCSILIVLVTVGLIGLSLIYRQGWSLPIRVESGGGLKPCLQILD
jgi:hypothetical protein